MPIPTVELHRHFEAGLRPETIARLAARHEVTDARTRSGQVVAGVDPQDPESIRRYYDAIAEGFTCEDGFDRFVDSFGLPLSALQSLEDLEEAVFDQVIDCAASGSLHTELRGSPVTYRDRIAAPLEEVAEALVRGVDRAWRERGASGTFLLAFSRQKGLSGPGAPPASGQARVVARLAAALHRADRPVGIDIAGYPEDKFPPRLFEEALGPAREAGVPLTVHAGEQGKWPACSAAPPALVVEAVTRLGAHRIGHGTSLATSREARALIKERGIGIECCPVSNARMDFTPLASHPLPLFLEEGLAVSLATDDPLMFGDFSVEEAFNRMAGALGLGEDALLRLTRNGLDTAFVSDERRRILHARLAEASFPPSCSPSS